MELTIFLTLMSLAGLFLIVGALSKDRITLLPAGAFLLLTGFFLIGGTGLEIQNGVNKTYTTYENSTVVDYEEPRYQKVEFPVESVEFSDTLGFLLIMLALYFFYIPSDQLKFRSIARRFSYR
jgi:hypothetical protein